MAINSFKALFPHEHGAWGLLIIPLLTGSLVAPVHGWPLAGLWASALGVFLLRKPAVQEIKRILQPDIKTTLTWPVGPLVACVFLVLAGSVPLLFLKRWGLAVPILFAGLAFGLEGALPSWRQSHRLMVELLDVCSLCLLAPSAVYVSTGKWSPQAVGVGALCLVYYAISTVDVRRRLAWFHLQRGIAPVSRLQESFRDLWITTGLCFIGLSALVALGWIAPWMLAGLIPLGLRFLRPDPLRSGHPRAARTLGWQEVAYSILFSITAAWAVL